MMVLACFIYDRNTPFPSVYALLPVVGTVLVLLFGQRGTLAAAILSWRPLVGIGMISYSAYLWHQPIFALARLRLYDPPSLPLMAGLCLLTLALATISWRYVEQPFRRRTGATAVPLRRLLQFAVGGAALLAAASAIALVSNGAPFRFGPQVLAMNDRFTAVFNERLETARVGYCELNTKIVNVSIADFEKNWSCLPHKGSNLADNHIAIFGDSHSSDIAAAMRSNGQDVLHIAGAGCALSVRSRTFALTNAVCHCS